MKGKNNLNPNFLKVRLSEDVGLTQALTRAKQNGALNLQGRGLTVFPDEICQFSELRLGENWWD